jgi:tetratricopeptide (TPR) repeat protein
MIHCSGEISVRNVVGSENPAGTAMVRASVASPPPDAFLLDVNRDANGAASRNAIRVAPRPGENGFDRPSMLAVADSIGLIAGYEEQLSRAQRGRFGIIATAVIALIVAIGFAMISVAAMRLRQEETASATASTEKLSQEWRDQVERSEQSLAAAQERFHQQTQRTKLLEAEVQELAEKCKSFESQLLRATEGMTIADERDPARAMRRLDQFLANPATINDPARSASLLCALGSLENMHGRFAMAQACFARALELSPLLGSARTDSLAGLAQAYQKQGRFAEAKTIYRELIDLSRGEVIPSRTSLSNLAAFATVSLRAEFNPETREDDENLIVQSIDRLLTYLPQDDTRLAQDWRPKLMELADAALLRGKRALATRVLERACALSGGATAMDETLADDPGHVCERVLAQLYEESGQLGDARRLVAQRVRAFRRDPSRAGSGAEGAASAAWLASLDERLGDLDGAEEMLKLALSLRETSLGGDHQLVADTMDELARIYVKKGKNAEADAVRASAAQIWSRRAHANP